MAQLKWGQKGEWMRSYDKSGKMSDKKSKIGKCPKVKTEYDDFHELFRL